jgi:hypothetical protein
MIQEREVTFPTNFNKKLDCDIFIHIQAPHRPGIAAGSVFTVKTKDLSHEPVKARIIDSIHQPLRSLSATFTYLSHGISPEEFKAMILQADPKVNEDTVLAVYFYQKQAA